MRVLLFGGSFDPIHHGHLIAARAAAEALGFERVLLIPCGTPPHKPGARASGAARLAMCGAAIAGDPLFDVSDVELLRTGRSFTLHTVRHFAEQGMSPVSWLIGFDSLADLHNWHAAAVLLQECTMVTAKRPGCQTPDLRALRTVASDAAVERLLAHVIETPLVEISASDIRARVAQGRSIRYLTPQPVVDWIARSGLYGVGVPDAARSSE